MPTSPSPHGRLYAHQAPFLRAGDVHPLPYLGGPEDRLRAAFHDTYAQLRAYFRSPSFADELSRVMPDVHRTTELIDAYLDDGQVAFHGFILPTITKVCAGGAALARAAFDDDPVTKAAVEPQYRFRATGRRPIGPRPHPFAGPRLAGLRPTRSPRPAHSFNADARHIAAAKALSLNLVTAVTDSQRAKIRTVVTQAITRGINVADTGNRVANIVGLFPRWQIAVNNLYARMLDNDVPKRIADARARDYADELLAKRGIMIARTELMRAMNSGRLAGWHDLGDRGLLDPATSVKEWHGAIDDRICPECEYLADPRGDGEGERVVGLDTVFDTDYGRIVMPPAHPHCRCTVLLYPQRTERQEAALTGDDAAMANDPEIAMLSGQMS